LQYWLYEPFETTSLGPFAVQTLPVKIQNNTQKGPSWIGEHEIEAKAPQKVQSFALGGAKHAILTLHVVENDLAHPSF